MPKRPPPKVEEVNDAVAAEFADFDDGPANVVEVVTPEIVDTPDAPPSKTPQNNRKSRSSAEKDVRDNSIRVQSRCIYNENAMKLKLILQ